MIHLDAGEDKQAVEWIRKALAGREKQSSPNLDATVENLESEIAALKRLGRKNEAAAAQNRLASVRATMQSIQQVGGDLGAIKNQEEGAVFVELPFGNRPVRSEGRRSLSFLDKHAVRRSASPGRRLLWRSDRASRKHYLVLLRAGCGAALSNPRTVLEERASLCRSKSARSARPRAEGNRHGTPSHHRELI